MNPYEILGVSKSASQADIKAAYHKAARKNHPDAGGDVQKFKEIQLAYEILIDPQRRQRYDQTGDVRDNAKPTVTEAEELILCMIPEAFLQNRDDPLSWIRRKLVGKRFMAGEAVTGLKAESRRHSEKLEVFRKNSCRAKNESGYDLVEGALLANIAVLDAEGDKISRERNKYCEAIAMLDHLKCPPDNDRRTYAASVTIGDGAPFTVKDFKWAFGPSRESD